MSVSSNSTRTERDALGELPVPVEALWGIHTQRALANFPVSGRTVQPELIRAMVQIKKACALAHKELHELSYGIVDAIVSACDEVLAGKHADAFVTDALQGGAGIVLAGSRSLKCLDLFFQ